MPYANDKWLACPDCDLLMERLPLAPRLVAHCPRCDAPLFRGQHEALTRPLALAIACALLFLVLQVFPLVDMRVGAVSSATTLTGTALALQEEGMDVLAGLALFSAVLAPAAVLFGLLYVLAPLALGQRWPAQGFVFMAVEALRRWAMLEVFLLGALVAFGKLASLAALEPRAALWALGALVVLWAALSASLDEEAIWQRL